MNTDLFGYTPPRAPFKDIRPQRDSVAEEKAILCKQLGELCRTVPESIRSADIRRTREWVACMERAKKVLSSKRSSRVELQGAIEQMRAYS